MTTDPGWGPPYPRCTRCDRQIASQAGLDANGLCAWCRPPIIVKAWPDGSRTEDDGFGQRRRVWDVNDE